MQHSVPVSQATPELRYDAAATEDDETDIDITVESSGVIADVDASSYADDASIDQAEFNEALLSTAEPNTLMNPDHQRRDSREIGLEESEQQEADYALDTPMSTQSSRRVKSTPASPTTSPIRESPETITAGENLLSSASSVKVKVNGVRVTSQLPSTDTALLSHIPNRLPGSVNLPSATNPTPDIPKFGMLGVYAALIGAQACWSGFHLFAKIAFDYMHPMVLPCIRALGTTPVMFLICYHKDKNFWRIPREDLKQIAALGVIICCFCQNLFNLGLMLTTAADGGITQPAVPVFAALMAILLKRESASVLKFSGIACAIVGTLCIVIGETYLIPATDSNSTLASGAGGSARAQDNNNVTPGRRLLGIGCFMLQCFLFSVYLLIQKPLLARLPTITITFYTFLFGIPGTTVIAAYFAATTMDWAHLPAMWFVSIAYTILIASVAGFLLFSYATKHLPASASSMGVTMQPFFSSLLGALILGEVLTYMHIIGGLFLITGLAIVLWSRAKESAQNRAQADLERIRRENEGDDQVELTINGTSSSLPPFTADTHPILSPDSTLDDIPESLSIASNALTALKNRLSPPPPNAVEDLDTNPAHISIDDAIATGSKARRQSQIPESTSQKLRAKIMTQPGKDGARKKNHPRLGPAVEDPFQ